MTDFLEAASANEYSRYGLEENPFPYSPVPSDSPNLYCGQQQVTDAIRRTASTTLRTGKSRHLVVTGNYGNGKSHTLKYTRSLLRKRDNVVVGYVSQPGNGFEDIYREFVYDLGLDRLQSFAYEYLASVVRGEFDVNPTSANEMSTLIDEGEILLSDLVPVAIQSLSETTEYADFSRAMTHLIYEDTRLYGWQWLTGEGIRYEQRKQMQIHSALDDDISAVRAFTALKEMLRHLGYVGVFMFVDEFENIARLSPKDEQTVLNSIRHLIDQNSSGLCLLLACAPEIWEDVMREYHAFAERIGEEVALKPLDYELARDLVVSYLNMARQTSGGIEPFSEDSLQLILQHSQGNIRRVLATCSRVLDYGLDTNKDRLTESTVQECLASMQ